MHSKPSSGHTHLTGSAVTTVLHRGAEGGGGLARTRTQACTGYRASFGGSWPQACRGGGCCPGTVPRLACPAGWRSSGASRGWAPPGAWRAPCLPRTPPWGGSPCWRCGQGILHCPVRSPGPSRLACRPKTCRHAPGARAVAVTGSPGFWGARGRSDGGVWGETPGWDQAAGEPQRRRLSNI